MTERNRKIMVLALLAVAVVWGAWNLLPDGGNSGEPEDWSSDSDSDPDVAALGGEVALLAVRADTLAWGDDPFARRRGGSRRSGTTITESKFNLTAVSSQAGNMMAILNGAVVRVGDELSGWEIAEIEPDKVLLTRGERSRCITMKGL
jgi:hypothetical protein